MGRGGTSSQRPSGGMAKLREVLGLQGVALAPGAVGELRPDRPQAVERAVGDGRSCSSQVLYSGSRRCAGRSVTRRQSGPSKRR